VSRKHAHGPEEGKAPTAIAALVHETLASGLEAGWFGWSGLCEGCNARQRLESSSTRSGVPPFLQSAATAIDNARWGACKLCEANVDRHDDRVSKPMASFRARGVVDQFWGTLQELQGDLERLDDVLENKTGGRIDAGRSRSTVARNTTPPGASVQGLTFGYGP
jgi:hypothetical protein